jgi:hypothetical protein
MQSLQSTFANRFNRSVMERGHVFQGRYKSLVVERDAYLGSLVNKRNNTDIEIINE